MFVSYADVLESFIIDDMAIESSKSDNIVTAIVGIPAIAILGYQLTKGFIEWKKEKKNSAEATKKREQLLEDIKKEFDDDYDNVNKKYLAMRNDIKKAIKSLNGSKVINEIKSDIKEDFKDDPELMQSLLEGVYNGMFSIDNSAIPMSSTIPKGDEDEFSASTTDNSIHSYMAPYLHEIADVINLKYGTDLTVEDHYAKFAWDPRTLLNK